MAVFTIFSKVALSVMAISERIFLSKAISFLANEFMRTEYETPNSLAPALILAYGIGRIGCQMSGVTLLSNLGDATRRDATCRSPLGAPSSSPSSASAPVFQSPRA